ncbi:hypothetical protein [Serratia ficaria]|uniref:hypothetical protein n=1 Tax=Serratia ficaria TaxID=61651 RepID=UPI000BA2E69B|nr:hypothetical protein [Serratia ficaria]
MVILVVLTSRAFRFSLFISQLMAKAIPVRGAILEKPAQGNLSGLFAYRSQFTPSRFSPLHTP